MSETRKPASIAFGAEGTKKSEREQERRANLIAHYIQEKVIKGNNCASKEEENAIKLVYKDKSPREKAEELYQKMMIYMQEMQKRRKDRQTGQKQDGINPKLISRIKILFNDPEVASLLPETYGQARVDERAFRASDIFKMWNGLQKSIKTKKDLLADIKQKLFQETIQGEDNIEEARATALEIAEQMEEDGKASVDVETLVGYEKTEENTDVAALMCFERLKEYGRQQEENGFVWLPSREEIDRKAMKVIESGNPRQTRKGIFFISEPGTGKTEQIRAIAERLTGSERVKISCGPRMGEPQLLGKGSVFPGATEIEKGTFTDFRNTVSDAWTGYDYSYQDKRSRDHARVVELDEFPKAFENETAFSILKSLFALKDGDYMSGTDKTVLPGRVIIGSGNIGQHHGAKAFPPALEREFVVIPVDYIEMTKENPEQFEYMLSILIQNGGIGVAESEIAPAYKRQDLPEDNRPTLEDGSTVIAENKLVDDPTDNRHGVLYRFAYAVKAVQNSYMARGGENAYIDYSKRDILRYKDNDDGSISVSDTGERIILGTTITVGDIYGCLLGYQSQRKKKKPMMLAEWLQVWLKEKVDAKHEDKDKLQAIFNHFHLFDAVNTRAQSGKPMTPKEIGYASPRVPRPLYYEKPKKPEGVNEPETGKDIRNVGKPDARPYESAQVITSDNSSSAGIRKITIKKIPFTR